MPMRTSMRRRILNCLDWRGRMVSVRYKLTIRFSSDYENHLVAVCLLVLEG